MSEKLLLEESPLVIIPSLAIRIGLDESIVLQQVHYWLNQFKKNKSKEHFSEDKWWVCNSYKQWKEDNFPFYTEEKIKRTFLNLEKMDLVISKENENGSKWNHRKKYTINYAKKEIFA